MKARIILLAVSVVASLAMSNFATADEDDAAGELTAKFKITTHRPDDAVEVHPLLRPRLGHDVGGLLLGIELAVVGDGRALEQVHGVVDAVVKGPELLLEPGRPEGLLLEDLEEAAGLGEAGAGVEGEPAVGVIHGELPARGASHREASERDPVVVDRVAAPDRLEDVNLAGELEGVAGAAVGL